MDSNIENQELIERFLDGKTSDDENAAFAARLAAEPALAELLESENSFRAGVEYHFAKQTVGQVGQVYFWEKRIERRALRRALAWAAAAAIVPLFLAFWAGQVVVRGRLQPEMSKLKQEIEELRRYVPVAATPENEPLLAAGTGNDTLFSGEIPMLRWSGETGLPLRTGANCRLTVIAKLPGGQNNPVCIFTVGKMTLFAPRSETHLTGGDIEILESGAGKNRRFFLLTAQGNYEVFPDDQPHPIQIFVQ